MTSPARDLVSSSAPDATADNRPRQPVETLLYRHARTWFAVSADAWSIETRGGEWALWTRVDKEWAVRQCGVADHDAAVRAWKGMGR